MTLALGEQIQQFNSLRAGHCLAHPGELLKNLVLKLPTSDHTLYSTSLLNTKTNNLSTCSGAMDALIHSTNVNRFDRLKRKRPIPLEIPFTL